MPEESREKRIADKVRMIYGLQGDTPLEGDERAPGSRRRRRKTDWEELRSAVPTEREREVQDLILDMMIDAEWSEATLRDWCGGDAAVVSRALRLLLHDPDREVVRLGKGKRGNPFRYIRATVYGQRVKEEREGRYGSGAVNRKRTPIQGEYRYTALPPLETEPTLRAAIHRAASDPG